MFTAIVYKIIAKFYHYILAIDRRVYRAYIADKHVFSNMGVNLRGHIYLYSTKIKVGKDVSIWPNVYFSGDNIIIGDNV